LSILTIPTARVFAPLLDPARDKGAHGGRGSGKSHFFAGLLIEDSLANKGLLSACIREVQKSLKDSAKRLIESKLAEQQVARRFQAGMGRRSADALGKVGEPVASDDSR